MSYNWKLHKNKRVAIAMSGGVDSSVAAYLLKEAGYDVIGFSMQLWPRNTGGGCCGVNAMCDAARVAKELDIPHYILDVREEFNEKIIDDFYFSYEIGETPNPCVRCNEFIKFEYLLRKAEELDAIVATGHYAQVTYDEPNDQYRLYKGLDPSKDQSYMLYRFTQEQLSKTLFPIGGYNKSEIRDIARKMNIYVAEKPDSQDICFQDKTNFRELMQEKAPKGCIPGNIVRRSGEILGQHQGIAFYTVGQRKRLGISYPTPLYVLEIDAVNNQVVVGEEVELSKNYLDARNLNILRKDINQEKFLVEAKIRYKSASVPAEVTSLGDGRAKVAFFESQKGISPGQSVVFYDGDEIIGGGVIDKSAAPKEVVLKVV